MKNKKNNYIKLFREKRKEKKLFKKTALLRAAIYSFDDFNKIIDHVYWGGSSNYVAIYGDKATEQAELLGITITGKLLSCCKYVFRYTMDKAKLVPGRVSMHPKTAANIERGSIKYGYGHILNEGW